MFFAAEREALNVARTEARALFQRTGTKPRVLSAENAATFWGELGYAFRLVLQEKEIVRVASPVTFMRRTATKATSMSVYDFEEGDKVVMFYGAANRDPKVFDDPETFDVRRDPNPHVGFGGPGPHFCLGAHLARREVSVAFRQLLTRLPDIEIAGDPVPLDAMGIPLVGGIKHLPVTFTPTARSSN